MNRRHFLRQSGAVAAVSALLGPGAARAFAAARTAPIPAELGIQLYTLRDILPGDVNGVLETLARVGIGEVETAGYADRDPADFAAVLDTIGLATPSAHQLVSEVVTSSEMMANAGLPDFETALETIATVGHDYFVIPWLPPDARPDRDGYLRLADLLNGFGERAKAAGVQLAYHNHDFEFETFGTDRPAYFDFVERLDPDLPPSPNEPRDALHEVRHADGEYQRDHDQDEAEEVGHRVGMRSPSSNSSAARMRARSSSSWRYS